jgi:hypothetical protein
MGAGAAGRSLWPVLNYQDETGGKVPGAESSTSDDHMSILEGNTILSGPLSGG